MSPAMELGKGESPELNLAFPLKGGKEETDYSPTFQAESSMGKVRLLESHLLDAPFLRAISQSGKDILNVLSLNIAETIRNREDQDRISIHNVENEGPKGDDKSN